MQHSYTFLGLLLALCVAIASCKKEVTKIDLTNVDDKIVLQSYLCPQSDSIYVSLTVASGTLSNRKKLTIEDLKAAKVSIESEGVSKILPFEKSIIEYLNGEEVGAIFAISQEQMPIIPDKLFTIRVSNESKFEAYASTMVPDEHFIDFDFTISDSIYDNKNNVYYNNLNVVIPDIKNKVNYYSVGAYNKTRNFYLQLDKEWNLTDNNDELDYILFQERLNIFDASDSLYIFVANISEDYFKFQSTLQKALSTGKGNPFVEPGNVYSNVKGGYGVVGSMVLSMKLR